MAGVLRTECPECFSVFRLKDPSAVGKRMKCRNCGQPFRIEPAGKGGTGASGDPWDSAPLPAAAPVLRSGAKTRKKKPKSKPFPWKPLAGAGAGLVLMVAVAWGGWQMLQKVSPAISARIGGGPVVWNDTHESLLDANVETYEELGAVLQSIRSESDIPAAIETIEELATRKEQYDERTIVLGEIELQRVEEINKYTTALLEKMKPLQERIKPEAARLREAGLVTPELATALRKLTPGLIPVFLTVKLQEPDSSSPTEIAFHTRATALRKALAVLVQMRDASSAEQHAGELAAVTEELQRLNSEHDNSDLLDSFPTISRSTLIDDCWWHSNNAVVKIAERVRERAADNADAVQAVNDLLATVTTVSGEEYYEAKSAAIKQGNGQSQPPASAAGDPTPAADPVTENVPPSAATPSNTSQPSGSSFEIPANDSYDALLSFYTTYFERLEEILKKVKSKDDVPAAVLAMREVYDQVDLCEERTILLGPITREQANKLVQDRISPIIIEQIRPLNRRLKSEWERIREAGLARGELYEEFHRPKSTPLAYELVVELFKPDRDSSGPDEGFLFDRTTQLRRLNTIMVQMRDDASAREHVGEFASAVQEFRRITEQQGNKSTLQIFRDAGGEQTRNAVFFWLTNNAAVKIATRVRARAAGCPEAVKAADDLLTQISKISYPEYKGRVSPGSSQ